MAPSQMLSVDIGHRDLALFRGLFECRIMTAAHIAALYFDGRKEATKKRLQKLKAAGFLGERTRRVNEPSVLHLTQKAFVVLRANGTLSEYPTLLPSSLDNRAHVSDLTLRHELEVMDVKAAFHWAIKEKPRFEIAAFSTWPALYQFAAHRSASSGVRVLVKPDGFIRIHERETDGELWEHTFFLEVDRSTETQDTLAARAACYLDYYKSGGFAVRNGANRSDYKQYPFRVLMIFKSAERRNNTAEKLLQNVPPIFTHVWLSTLEEVRADPLGAIWIRPLDYRTATQGTAYDAERHHASAGYRRRAEREEFIGRNVKKNLLLA